MNDSNPQIQVLNSSLIDQIAAGEVVERPSSVVKELLENAMDAGATQIVVEVEQGGSRLIRITDNGHGMSKENAILAIERHATSKLRAMEDLQKIRTMGFRGEALPSIASVCRFLLTTRRKDNSEGTQIALEGGQKPDVREIGCSPGTTVEVRDLFFNVPARKKFLKSKQTESAHISQVCQRVALAYPELRLIFYRDGKRAKEYLPVISLEERAKIVFPNEKLTSVLVNEDALEIHGMLGAPEAARSGAVALHLFVQGRPIRDRALARAIAFAYGSVIPPGRYPAGVVSIFMDPAEIDVNVHPQKLEVRFSEGRAFYDKVTQLLASKLRQAQWGNLVGNPSGGSGPKDYWKERLDRKKQGGSTVSGVSEPTDSDPWAMRARLEDTFNDNAAFDENLKEKDHDLNITSAVADQNVSSAFAGLEPQGLPSTAPTLQSSIPQALIHQGGRFGRLRVLGQSRKMFILAEGEDGLHVIDQHAADERVRFHQLKTSYENQNVKTQRLLFPERIEVAPHEATLIEESHSDLVKLGMDCTLLGPTTVAIHTVPTLVNKAPPERLLRDVLDEIGKSGGRNFSDAIDTALATMACHGAIRGGDTLSPKECAALLEAMDKIEDFGGHCPHGRPVVFSIEFAKLERMVGR